MWKLGTIKTPQVLEDAHIWFQGIAKLGVQAVLPNGDESLNYSWRRVKLINIITTTVRLNQLKSENLTHYDLKKYCIL